MYIIKRYLLGLKKEVILRVKQETNTKWSDHSPFKAPLNSKNPIKTMLQFKLNSQTIKTKLFTYFIARALSLYSLRT